MGDTVKQADTFLETLGKHGVNTRRGRIDLLQLNIGKKCNQCCIHCHVNAGPARTEEMSLKTIDRILLLLSRNQHIKTVDITGGAPELNPNFKYLICKLKEMGVQILDRCNLTVLFEEGQETTAEFLAANNITIIASLPCYTEENVDKQRGRDIYYKSIKALRLLNDYGYGKAGSGKLLNLVYNPLGAFLPGRQEELEEDYKNILWKEHGIIFNKLFTITNMPINRFAHLLMREGSYENYCTLLAEAFQVPAAERLMCKHQISVSWDGKLYDCDFNQALDIPIIQEKADIWAIEDFGEIGREIVYARHCFGCSAGFGSSCQGKLV